MIDVDRAGLARPVLLLAAVPGLMLLVLTVLMLIRGRLDIAAVVFGGGAVVTLLVGYTTRVRLRLLRAALADVPRQARRRAWRDAARGAPPADEQARAWALRLARYQLTRLRGVGLADPIVMTTGAAVFAIFAVVQSRWVGLVAVYCLLRAVAFVVNWNHYRRRLTVLTG